VLSIGWSISGKSSLTPVFNADQLFNVADGQEGPDDLTQRDDRRQNSDKGVLSPETSAFMMLG